MKKSILLISAVFALTACSSGSDSKKAGGAPAGGGPTATVTVFAKDGAGEWLSECQHSPDGNFIDDLTLNADGTGKLIQSVFQAPNCLGTAEVQAPKNFTYTAEAPSAGSTNLLVTFESATQSIPINVSVQ